MADETIAEVSPDPVKEAREEIREEQERIAEAEAIAHEEGRMEAHEENAREREREETARILAEVSNGISELSAQITAQNEKIAELEARMNIAEETVVTDEIATETAIDVEAVQALETPTDDHRPEADDHKPRKKHFVKLFD